MWRNNSKALLGAKVKNRGKKKEQITTMKERGQKGLKLYG